MKDNKHPHHDLIVEWAEDTTKQLQGRRIGLDEWLSASVSNLTDADPDYEFRIKPREFIKGHWYPALKMTDQSDKFGKPYYFDGVKFRENYRGDDHWMPSYFRWIGKSLGEINFGE